MNQLVVASNMYNERDEVEEWLSNVTLFANGGILVVDTGSDDGTDEYLKSQGVVVVTDDIIRREGYGSARNHLREMSISHFPNAHWMIYLDADERIPLQDLHRMRFICEYLVKEFDVVAFPRIDWLDRDMSGMGKDWRGFPDYQARMSRLYSDVVYHRRLHEQVQTKLGVYANIENPKINHFHRSTPSSKRDTVGKLCAYLHGKDELGHTYPEHHKEAHYRELLEKEGF